MNTNEEVLKQIKESKKVGEYMIQGFTPVSHGVFNETLGYSTNSCSGISQKNIDSDSFLKNLHAKNAYKIKNNPLNQDINFKPSVITGRQVNTETRERKSVDNTISKQDISSRFYAVNLRNPQQFINYSVGIDSRHQNR
jgi:hypothetical protein